MKINLILSVFKIMLIYIIKEATSSMNSKENAYHESIISFSNNNNNLIYMSNQNHKSKRTSNLDDDKYHVVHSNYTLYPSSDYNKGYEFATGDCEYNKNCFLPFGVCVNETTCMCMPDYANVVINNNSFVENNLHCSYKKKKVVVAATLELFLPLGLGHFYAEQYLLAFIKILYNFLVYGYGYILYYKGLTDNSKISSIAFCIILTCLIPIWNLVDVALFFTYTFKDGNGIPMS